MLVAALVLANPWTLVARADTNSDASAAEAKAHYKKGQAHYELGEWTAAADEYKAAFRLAQKPALLFNIAQAYRQAQDWKHAAFFYRKFLELSPRREPNRGLARKLLKKSEKELMNEEVPSAPPVPPPAPPKPAPPVQVAPVRAPALHPVEEPTPLPPVPDIIVPARPVAPVKPAGSPPFHVILAHPEATPGEGTAETKPELPPAALAPTPPKRSPAGLIIGWSATALLAVGSLVAYLSANQQLDAMTASQHTRAQADSLLQSAGSRQTLSLSLGIAAFAGAAVSTILTASGSEPPSP